MNVSTLSKYYENTVKLEKLLAELQKYLERGYTGFRFFPTGQRPDPVSFSEIADLPFHCQSYTSGGFFTDRTDCRLIFGKSTNVVYTSCTKLNMRGKGTYEVGCLMFSDCELWHIRNNDYTVRFFADETLIGKMSLAKGNNNLGVFGPDDRPVATLKFKEFFIKLFGPTKDRGTFAFRDGTEIKVYPRLAHRTKSFDRENAEKVAELSVENKFIFLLTTLWHSVRYPSSSGENPDLGDIDQW